jgi:outer membrane protein assembly factor BamA
MPFTKNIVLLFCIFLTIFIELCFGNHTLKAQTGSGYFPSRSDKYQIEIDEINIKGFSALSERDLRGVIGSRPSNRNWYHQVIQYYYEQFNKNAQTRRVSPKSLIRSLKKALKTMMLEVHFYTQPTVDNDVLNLIDLYNQNGYHDAKVSYTFLPDSSKKKNILTFNIIENNHYSIKSLVLSGLDSLPDEVSQKIKPLINVRTDEMFSESKIIEDIRSIHNCLQDNGYYFTNFDTPVITKDSVNFCDSVYIRFNTGKRQRIGSINYIDSTKGQKPVINGMKELQLEFKPGDWYSRTKIMNSINNLNSLGTFEITNIDSSTVFSKMNDTTLPILVFNQYRKQQEGGLGFYINKTAIVNYTNAGMELSYSHRNIGGIAQSLSLFGKAELQDISRILDSSYQFQPQLQFGINFAQPFLFSWDVARFGGAIQLIYSKSRLNNDIELNTFSMPVRLPIKLPDYTYLQSGSLDLLIEGLEPIDYSTAYNKAMINATSTEDIQKVESYFNFFRTINNYRKVPTALIIGGSLTGDKRNDIFNPTKGYFFNVSLDFTPGLGLAKFFRAQLSYYLFESLNNNTVFALKLRGGKTFNFGVANASYIPFDRQFYSGGANSVRGWSSRRLRYPQPPSDTSYINNFFQDFVGSLEIIEGSIELRFRFRRPDTWSPAIADQIANLGLTGFIDFGNTFHWLLDEEYSYNALDYITKLAVAAGFGITYQTPVGPARVDIALPMYDPSAETNKFIFSSKDIFKEMKFHIGLGYSF